MLARRFENAETLSGHTSSITTLRFSPEGEYLASGCEGGVVLVTSTESWQIVQKAVNISPVTALRWDCTFPMTLVCGFASGAVLTVHIGDTDNDLGGSDHIVWGDVFQGPIHCIATDDLGRKLAIGHGCEVALLDQRTLSHWENIRTIPDPPEFVLDLPAPSPRALHFTNEGNLIGIYLNHGIVCWDVSSMTVLWNIVPRSCTIGWSTISPGEKHIVVSNLFDGLDFYSIADRTLSHSVPCPMNQQKNVPVPVLFNGDGSSIIVGGTSGSVRVLDSSSCETLQVLPHQGDLIQAIDSCITQDGAQIIAAGVSEKGEETTIKIWTSQPTLVSLRSSLPTPIIDESRPVHSSHRRLIMLSISIGLLSLCFFFVTQTRSDLWTERWRGFLLQLLNGLEANL